MAERTAEFANGTGLRLGLPKGAMQEGVIRLLADAGIRVAVDERGYRPRISLPGFEAKLLKPQNIIEMLDLGSRDLGFAGADWVAELDADVVEVLDTGLDPVRLVAAAPKDLLEYSEPRPSGSGFAPKVPNRSLTVAALKGRRIVIASEYENLAQRWIEENKLDATLVRSYGATEVFPPEDADCIIDNTASGATLRANGLVIIDELMTSTTRLYASRSAMANDDSRCAIERLALLLRSVLEARRRVMLEVNVSAEALEQVIAAVPAMREPTISKLHGGAGYAIKAAVPRNQLAIIIPEIKERGGTDIVVTATAQIVP